MMVAYQQETRFHRKIDRIQIQLSGKKLQLVNKDHRQKGNRNQKAKRKSEKGREDQSLNNVLKLLVIIEKPLLNLLF